ncbi:hypothetical protein OJAV_G00211240 [Oryzias javanicus]|uniref:Uncharacterized protein n=1 Tax=Oryzias javanicus TaxID=123683 RepID=A0A437C2E9_ORYJA|nr:hypothetical protein OJAV_G00211240 [Oryzias javanicus]
MHDKLEELQKQCLETYGEADIHTSSLKQNLKEHEQQKKQQPEIQSSEETKISVVAPPRKKKRSVEKCQVKLQENVSVKEESTSFGDAPSLPPEAPAGMEVREDGAVLEQTDV